MAPFNIGGNTFSSFNAKLHNSTSIIRSGLVLYLNASISDSYPGSGSTWYDLSGQGNHFTMQGNITWDQSSGFGNFQGNSTGSGNKFYCNNSSFAKAFKTANGGSGYTTIAWTRCTSTSGWQKLMGQSDSDSYIDLYAQSTTTNYHQEDGSTVWVNSSTVTNDTYTLNGAGWLMLSSTNSNGGTTTTPTYTFTIGNDPNGASTQTAYPWYGYINTVMVYNRVLSSTEILQNYQATRQKFERYYDCGYGCQQYNYDPGCTIC